MRDIIIVKANSDLGLTIDGADLGPNAILKKIDKSTIKKTINIDKERIEKSRENTDLKKNLFYVNSFNKELYESIIKEDSFVITLGGDHSVAIGSALASAKKHKNIGLIWIDAHIDYNTFETTITGNLHGLPLATINGLNPGLRTFTDNNNFIDPKNTFAIGYRSEEENKEAELKNAQKMGVTVYSDSDVKQFGIENILNEAFEKLLKTTDEIHISFDLDIINPILAPGVSTKEKGGISLDEVDKIISFVIGRKEFIKSFDLVEYNPLFDEENKTLNIAGSILQELIKTF